jgi:hypothetical protein
MSPATPHMSRMDPYKTDTDEFWRMQSIGSMQEAKHCLRIALMLFVWTGPDWIHARGQTLIPIAILLVCATSRLL